ncbi:MAG: hypothetical protein WCO98_06940, partial [bacterium]
NILLALIALFCICNIAFAQGGDVVIPKLTRLEAPVLVSPTNNSSLELTTVELTWRSVANASYYTIQVANNEKFTGNGVNTYTATGGNTYSLDNLTAGKYFWRVKAMPTNDIFTLNAQTNQSQTLGVPSYLLESNWSLVRAFTIKPATVVVTPPTPEVKTVTLPAPQLLTPLNGAFGVAVTTNLTWRAMNTSATYNIQIATDSKFTVGLVEVTGLTVASYSPQNLTADTHYYWRVKAIAPTTDAITAGTTTATTTIKDSEWSQVWAFNTAKVVVKMKTPEIIAPTVGATSGVIPELSWTGVDGARYYHVQAAKDSSFRYLVFGSELIPTTSVKLPIQPQGVTIYWRVRAVGNGTVTDWSPISSFTTEVLQIADGLEMKVRSKIADAGDIAASATVAGNRTSSYYISVKNTASRAVVISLTATGGQTGWTVNYFDGAGKLITKQIVNNSTVSTYSIKLAAFGSYCLRADVTPSSGSSAASQISNTITDAYADNAAINASVTINTYRK